MTSFEPCDSEVGVYDFSFSLESGLRVYVNVKSALKDGRTNKDDISKARVLEAFFSADPQRILLIATVNIEFRPDMSLRLFSYNVVPIMWLPDIYVNPSNNGNLQSSHYKDLSKAVRRTGDEFLSALKKEMAAADVKRRSKAARNDG